MHLWEITSLPGLIGFPYLTTRIGKIFLRDAIILYCPRRTSLIFVLFFSHFFAPESQSSKISCTGTAAAGMIYNTYCAHRELHNVNGYRTYRESFINIKHTHTVKRMRHTRVGQTPRVTSAAPAAAAGGDRSARNALARADPLRSRSTRMS